MQGLKNRRDRLSRSRNLDPPSNEELDALLRLLDDETPAVRERVVERLTSCGGDLSEWLAGRAVPLSPHERSLLAEILRPARREALAAEWSAPTGGATALGDDWDACEALLRMISDFLHDGITIRQPLSDALDLLAEEAAENGVTDALRLRSFLFSDGRLRGNRDAPEAPGNSDLAWSIAEGLSNPLGLCTIYILVAARLDLEVEAVNFPGHFLCRVHEDGYPVIVDCFDSGRLHLQASLLEDPDLGTAERKILRQSVGPGVVLLRLLNNLVAALVKDGRGADARLIRKLRASLR